MPRLLSHHSIFYCVNNETSDGCVAGQGSGKSSHTQRCETACSNQCCVAERLLSASKVEVTMPRTVRAQALPDEVLDSSAAQFGSFLVGISQSLGDTRPRTPAETRKRRQQSRTWRGGGLPAWYLDTKRDFWGIREPVVQPVAKERARSGGTRSVSGATTSKTHTKGHGRTAVSRSNGAGAAHSSERKKKRSTRARSPSPTRTKRSSYSSRHVHSKSRRNSPSTRTKSSTNSKRSTTSRTPKSTSTARSSNRPHSSRDTTKRENAKRPRK